MATDQSCIDIALNGSYSTHVSMCMRMLILHTSFLGLLVERSTSDLSVGCLMAFPSTC